MKVLEEEQDTGSWLKSKKLAMEWAEENCTDVLLSDGLESDAHGGGYMETGRSESLFVQDRDLILKDDDAEGEFDFNEDESEPIPKKKTLINKQKNPLKNSSSMVCRRRKINLDELIEMEIAEHKSHNNSTHEYLNEIING